MQIGHFPTLQTDDLGFVTELKIVSLVEDQFGVRVEIVVDTAIEDLAPELEQILEAYPVTGVGSWVMSWEADADGFDPEAFCESLDVTHRSPTEILGVLGESTQVQLDLEQGVIRALIRTDVAQAMQKAWSEFVDWLNSVVSGMEPESGHT